MLATYSVNAQNTLILSNCNTEEAGRFQYVGGHEGNVGFASRFTRYKMRAYKDCQLTSISVSFNGNAKGRVFATTSLTGTPLAEKSFNTINGTDNIDGMWCEVKFDEPLTLDGKELYIGYELESMTADVIVYTSPLVNGTEYCNLGNGWQVLSTPGVVGKFYATLTGDKLPKSEICLNEVSLPSFVESGKPFEPVANIVNLGTEKVTSLEVVYHNGNSDIIGTYTKTGLNISTRSAASISLPGVSLTGDTDYSFWVEVTKVNGIEDAAPVDNTSSAKTIYSRTNFKKRNILMEVFSTERCTGCPEGHATIEKTLGNKDDIIELCHHAGFYDDQFTIPASVSYEWFYKTPDYTTSYAPAVMLDRTNMYKNYPKSYAMDVPLFEPTAVRLNTAYAEMQSTPAFAELAISPSFNYEKHEIIVDVDASVEMLLPQHTNVVLNVFLTEDNVFSTSQANSNGSYYHRNVARACLTPTWGDALTGGKISKSYTVEADPKWNLTKMSVVAFVSNYDKQSNNNCPVLNSAKKVLGYDPTLDSIYEVNGSEVINRAYYSVTGIRLQQPQKGCLVIDRYADGTIKKRIQY